MILENIVASGTDVTTTASAYIFLGIMGFLGVLIYLHYKYRDRLFGKVLTSGKVHTDDITGKVTSFTWNSCRYDIDLSKVVRIHPIIPKNAIYYLENCSKPIWPTGTKLMPGESELRPSAYELNNILRVKLSDLLKGDSGMKLHMPGFKWILLFIGIIIAAVVIAVVLRGSGSPGMPPTT